MRATAIAVCAACVAFLTTRVEVRPEQEAAVFRARTTLVVQNVTVTHKSGEPIEDLTASDFILTEDGQRQDIAFVQFERLVDDPESAAAASSTAPDPFATAGGSELLDSREQRIIVPPAGDTRYSNRRLNVLYFDLSAMPMIDQFRAYKGANEYIQTNTTPADVIAIMLFQDGVVRVEQDFTADRDRLAAVIDRLASGDAGADGMTGPDAAAFGQDNAEFTVFSTDRQLAALQRAAAMLGRIHQRKALIYFGSGLRLDGHDNQAQLRATVNAANRADVAISPIDARGLVATAPLGNATQASGSGEGLLSGALAQTRSVQVQRSRDALYALAADTGGRASFDSNDLTTGIVRASRAITSYYMLGYYTARPEADGKRRRVHVEVRRGLSARLSYRDGYYAEKSFSKFTSAERERQIEEAFLLEDPVTDISLATSIDYFQLNRAEYYVPVTLRMPGSELVRTRRSGATEALFDVIAEIKDTHGVTYRNVRDRLSVALSVGDAAQLDRRPVIYQTGFTLLPGDYVIKLLVRDRATGRMGTYQTEFVVPDLQRDLASLPTSSVVLSTQTVLPSQVQGGVDRSAAIDAADPLVHDGRRVIPNVSRVFRRGSLVGVFLEAYPAQTPTVSSLMAYGAIYSAERRLSEVVPSAVDGRPRLDRPRAVPIAFDMPLVHIEPGEYDLQVSVIDRDSHRAMFWRTTIVVVP
jgi:VWFA-related protein